MLQRPIGLWFLLGIRSNWLSRGRYRSLYLFIMRVIKQILVIREANHFCELHTAVHRNDEWASVQDPGNLWQHRKKTWRFRAISTVSPGGFIMQSVAITLNICSDICCVNNEMPRYHLTVSLLNKTKITFIICILNLQTRFKRDSYHWRRRYLGGNIKSVGLTYICFRVTLSDTSIFQ